MDNTECINKRDAWSPFDTQEYNQKYYQENRETIREKEREKTTCECGAIICRNKNRHMKSKKHLNWVMSQNSGMS